MHGITATFCLVEGKVDRRAYGNSRSNPRTFKVTGDPQQLTLGEARDIDPTLASGGTLAYTQLVGALHIWRIDNASQPGATIQSKLTEDPSVDVSPFISPNGRWLVFSRGWDNHRDVWIKDTSSTTEAPLLASGLEIMSPIIDDSGGFWYSRLAKKTSPQSSPVKQVDRRDDSAPVNPAHELV